jgi:hypothetical protein
MKTKNLVLVTILYLLYLLVARIPILSLKNVFFLLVQITRDRFSFSDRISHLNLIKSVDVRLQLCIDIIIVVVLVSSFRIYWFLFPVVTCHSLIGILASLYQLQHFVTSHC